jgi:hypothetical protein
MVAGRTAARAQGSNVVWLPARHARRNWRSRRIELASGRNTGSHLRGAAGRRDSAKCGRGEAIGTFGAQGVAESDTGGSGDRNTTSR